MNKNLDSKELYSEIRKMIFYMIPEKWEEIYLYASIIKRQNNEETGEMFFYYLPKSIIKRNPINVYEIPQKFNIDEEAYMNLATRLYDMLKELKHRDLEVKKINWSNITISIKNIEFTIEYNCDNLTESYYNSDDRIAIWQYRYLEYPIEKFSKQQRESIESYITELDYGQHKTIKYVEKYYEKHEHNAIQYDIGKNDKGTEYINIDKKNETSFQIVDDNRYYVYGKRNKRKNNKINEIKRSENKYTDEEEGNTQIKNQILKYKINN